MLLGILGAATGQPRGRHVEGLIMESLRVGKPSRVMECSL